MAGQSDDDARFWRSLERRLHREWLVITLFSLVLSIGLSLLSDRTGIERIDLTFYDSVLRAKPHPPAGEDIVVIAVDDGSIEQLGHWPWRRALHAELLTQLSEAKIVGFDIVFSEANPDHPRDDAMLAAAIARHGRVVLPSVVNADASALHTPLPAMQQAAAALGYINVYPDSDGTVRSLVLRQTLTSGVQVDHFTVALLGDRATAPVSGRKYLLPFAGPAGSFSFHSYAAVLRGDVPPETFRNKTVLVGAWASGLGDTFPTPMTRAGESMSGVEILANGVLSLQQGKWIHTLPTLGAALLGAVPVLLVCLVQRRLSPRHTFLTTLTLVAIWPLVCGALLILASLWIPFTATLVAIALAFILWNWRSQEASLQHIDRELETLRKAGYMESPDSGVLKGSYDRSLPARVRVLHQSIGRFRRAQQKREETLRFLSHDMRAPQSAILAMIEMHLRHPGEIPDAELLERIRQRASDTLDLMDAFVHLEHAEVSTLDLRSIELGDLVHEACDACWELARRRHIHVEVEDAPELAWVEGDRRLLRRVLQNLLDNALKYSPDHTVITCRVQREGDQWQVRVEDQGRGIPVDQLEHIFESFTRVAADTPGNASGAGLGLAFVRATARRHGGTVFARSQPGIGSTFILSLPVFVPNME